MMKNKIYKVLLMLFGIVLLLMATANIYFATKESTVLTHVLTALCLVITSFTGSLYLLTGYTKRDSVKFFVWFMGLYSFTELFGLIEEKSNPIISVMLLAIAYACAFTLTVARDLGKKKSIILSATVIFSATARVVVYFLTSKLTLFGIIPITKLFLSVTVLIIVLAKYHDKGQRNAK